MASHRELTKNCLAFEERADQIVAEYDKRKDLPAKSPYDSALGGFKRQSYDMLRKYISRPGGHKIIKSVIKRVGTEPVRLSYKGNEFYFGLVAIDPHQDILDKRRLELFAKQLKYADLHEVPGHLLVGFLYQSGSAARLRAKLNSNHREPWLGAQSTRSFD